MAIHLTDALQRRGGRRYQGDTARTVSFNRWELGIILDTYSRMVAAGRWRDYSISHLGNVAVFSVLRHSAEPPIYRIERHPSPSGGPDIYLVVGIGGKVLRRGNDLRHVMGLFSRQLLRVVS